MLWYSEYNQAKTSKLLVLLRDWDFKILLSEPPYLLIFSKQSFAIIKTDKEKYFS